jgi:hypothetical protein
MMVKSENNSDANFATRSSKSVNMLNTSPNIGAPIVITPFSAGKNNSSSLSINAITINARVIYLVLKNSIEKKKNYNALNHLNSNCAINIGSIISPKNI